MEVLPLNVILKYVRTNLFTCEALAVAVYNNFIETLLLNNVYFG